MFAIDSKVGWAVVLSVFSAMTVLGSIYLAFRIAVSIPPDYFTKTDAPTLSGCAESAGIARKMLRNSVGALLILAGVAMLVLPGQGLLTILSGLLVMDFPGKYRFERRLAAVPSIFTALNAIRKKAGKPPLRWSGSEERRHPKHR